MATYSDEGAIENYLTIDIDNSFSTQVDEWIEAVENYIDNYTGRTWKAEAETRYFDGNGLSEIEIDDFTSLTSVQILESNSSDVQFTLTEGLDNDYIKLPHNVTLKFKLKMTVNSQVAVWLAGTKRIKIVGIFGEATVPKDIKLATTMLVASIVEKGLKGGSVAQESLGDYSVSFKELDDFSSSVGVKQILNKYRIFRI